MNGEDQKHYCWFRGEEITKANESAEHIIPNSLGGRLRSKDLLCTKCNNELGQTIDDVLHNQLYLPTLLDINRQRSEPPKKVRVSSDSGKKYLIDKELIPQEEELRFEKSKDGEYTFYVRSEKEARKILKNKLPKQEIEKKVKEMEWKEERVEGPVFFDRDIIDGVNAFKAIYKIAINYFLFCGGDRRYIEHCVHHMKEEHPYNRFMTYYYPKEKIHKLQKNEISNLLFLRANPKEKIAYCYIELFSAHCFLVVLNYLYTGDDISRTYCHDPIHNQEIHKQVNLELTRDEIQKVKFPPCELNQDAFNSRISRVFEIVSQKVSFIRLSKS